MPRNMRQGEAERRAKAKREFALQRNELRGESTPRVSAAGVTSAPIKADDPFRAIIEEALAKRRENHG